MGNGFPERKEIVSISISFYTFEFHSIHSHSSFYAHVSLDLHSSTILSSSFPSLLRSSYTSDVSCNSQERHRVEKFQGEIEIDSRSTPKAILRRCVSSLALWSTSHRDPGLLSTIITLSQHSTMARCLALSLSLSLTPHPPLVLQLATVINRISLLIELDNAVVLDIYTKYIYSLVFVYP